MRIKHDTFLTPFSQLNVSMEDEKHSNSFMKKLLIMSVASLALLCSSCGLSRSATSNANLTQTQVQLTKKNFRVVRNVSGESTQNYVFGIGGMSRKSMDETAISDMYRNANLKGSQVIINTNVSHKSKMILIYNQVKAIATGTVIEFTDEDIL